MASRPQNKVIAQILADKAKEVFDAMRAGTPLDEIAKPLGCYPYHLTKFYGSSREHREDFRDALVVHERMRKEAKGPKKGKRANGDARAIVERNVEAILEMVSDGMTLHEIGEMLEVSRSRISSYFNEADDDLKARYAMAKTTGGEALAERSVAEVRKPAFDLVDAKMAELRASRAAWLAGKLNPVYGDKQQIDLNHKVAGNVSISINA